MRCGRRRIADRIGAGGGESVGDSVPGEMSAGWGVGAGLSVTPRRHARATLRSLPAALPPIVVAEEERAVPIRPRRLRYRDRPALLERYRDLSYVATEIDAQQR